METRSTYKSSKVLLFLLHELDISLSADINYFNRSLIFDIEKQEFVLTETINWPKRIFSKEYYGITQGL